MSLQSRCNAAKMASKNRINQQNRLKKHQNVANNLFNKVLFSHFRLFAPCSASFEAKPSFTRCHGGVPQRCQIYVSDSDQRTKKKDSDFDQINIEMTFNSTIIIH